MFCSNKKGYFSCFLIHLVLLTIILLPQHSSAASSFGTDYRHLTASSPVGGPDNTTTVTIGVAATGTFRVDPFTSGSTATGTPSSSGYSGYGWRTVAVVGSTVPAGTWSFTITTRASPAAPVANAVAKVYAYSADITGANSAGIGSATGTQDLFQTDADMEQTLTFVTSSPTDLTDKVLVVEYWFDVTIGPLIATGITFKTASSSQTVVLPSGFPYYLDKPSLFSIGETETTAAVSASTVGTPNFNRVPTETAAISDTGLSRAIITSRTALESIISDQASRSVLFPRQVDQSSGIEIADSVSQLNGYQRGVLETTGAAIADTNSRTTTAERSVAEPTDAAIVESVSRDVLFLRQVSETVGGALSDVITTAAVYVRDVAETSALLTDTISQMAAYGRAATEVTGAAISDSLGQMAVYARESSETTGALIVDSIIRNTEFDRDVMESFGTLISDTVSGFVTYARNLSEGMTALTDSVSKSLVVKPPPPVSEKEGREGGGGGGRSGGGFLSPGSSKHDFEIKMHANVNYVEGGEQILISGSINPVPDSRDENVIFLQVLSFSGELYTADIVDVSGDGSFSTKVVIGGPRGIDNQYRIVATYQGEYKADIVIQTLGLEGGVLYEYPCKLQTCTLLFHAGNKTFPINYKIAGILSNITSDIENHSLKIDVETKDSKAFLLIALPKEVIQSIRPDGTTEKPFIVLVDGTQVRQTEQKDPELAKQLLNVSDMNKVRILAISFSENVDEIEVVGTSAIPEFGYYPIFIVMVIAFVALITATKASRQVYRS